jgi:hypothetical protein
VDTFLPYSLGSWGNYIDAFFIFLQRQALLFILDFFQFYLPLETLLDISIGIEFGWQFLFYEAIDVQVLFTISIEISILNYPYLSMEIVIRSTKEG